ncbi:NADH dehydrogenase [ubiquinone] (complex I), alpha subcomplex subunit 1 [Phaffia rhodozyma]|uniref:NADH dehydrogenase [ubiquinone] 1 alpha subcomplex subunit 1 n=1 Tax=Phaffia rhodozyma TaxID=264483 RepID=A0A0F7SP24_PHARH|nr:NADH dehydrogenase [ubiquinone] (complex I), alpha subcomplex subunit 1 [Phaffia rhodozyma]
MPVPWEMLIPFGLITAMFTVTGIGMETSFRWDEDWKPKRYLLDPWEIQMMERDRRLTGSKRGQRDDPIAPPNFDTSSIVDVRGKI